MISKEERLFYAEKDAMEFRAYVNKLANHFHTVKKMEIENPENRDATFTKELVYAIEGCGIVIEVLARHKEINSGYALEKLNNAKLYLDQAIRHFNSKLPPKETTAVLEEEDGE
jgi:hypothetical protein